MAAGKRQRSIGRVVPKQVQHHIEWKIGGAEDERHTRIRDTRIGGEQGNLRGDN